MDEIEQRVRLKLYTEARSAISADQLRSRILGRLEAPTARRSRHHSGLVPGLAALAVTASVAGGMVLAHNSGSSPTTARLSSAGTHQSPQGHATTPPSQGQVNPSALYTPEQLTAATEQLLAASRSGAVPQISFVRNESDLSGLVVAVPEATIRQYGASRLKEIFTQVDQVETTSIQAAELPRNGLPLQPTAPTPPG